MSKAVGAAAAAASDATKTVPATLDVQVLTQASEVMVRENAFSTEDTDRRRQREEDVVEESEDARQIRRQIEANAVRNDARSGKMLRRVAEVLGIVDNKEIGWVPPTVPYIKTEHQFERLDEEYYDHPLHGKVSNHLYGKCIYCGKTFDELKVYPQDQRPSLTLCNAHQKKKDAQGAHKRQGGYFKKPN